MKILAIDTSCDETCCAVVENIQFVSSCIWSQANLHSSFGGVMPSLAQRQHQEHIDYVVNKALASSKLSIASDIDAIAVTVGPGLSIALGVGINKAKELAQKYNKPLIPINHVEAHLLSSYCIPKTKNRNKFEQIDFPAFGLVLSGGTTQLILIKDIGKYDVLAETVDDALGEALDKGARLLGFGYPGGALLEKMARVGNLKKYNLPIPLQGDKIKNRFSYSGLKTAFVRLFNEIKDPTKQDVADLAATYQNTAFEQVIKVLDYQFTSQSLKFDIKDLLFGGGVANNVEIRKKLRRICKKHKITLHIPYTNKLMGDNATMVGVCAYLKITNENLELKNFYNYDQVDRNPKLKI